MLKKIFLTSFLAYGFICSSQFEHASLNLGYASAKMNLETFRYTFKSTSIEGEAGTFSNQQGQSFKMSKFCIAGEIITKEFYMLGGLNLPIKVPREISSLNDGVKYRFYEKNPFYLKAAKGFGSEKFCFYLGAQYEFNRMETNSALPDSIKQPTSGTCLANNPQNDGNYAVSFYGGHQAGINLGFLFAPTGKFGLRGMFYVDKTWMNGIPKNVHIEQHFEGSVFTSELALYYYFNEDKHNGLKISLMNASRKMTGSSLDKPIYWPENKSKTTYFSFSLLLNMPGFGSN